MDEIHVTPEKKTKTKKPLRTFRFPPCLGAWHFKHLTIWLADVKETSQSLTYNIFMFWDDTVLCGIAMFMTKMLLLYSD